MFVTRIVGLCEKYPLHFLQGGANYVLCWLHNAVWSSAHTVGRTASIPYIPLLPYLTLFKLQFKIRNRTNVPWDTYTNCVLENLIICTVKIVKTLHNLSRVLSLKRPTSVWIYWSLKEVHRTASLIKFVHSWE